MNGRFALGAILVIAGILALLNNMGIIFIPSLWRLFWPLVIIWVGVNMIRRGPRHRRFRPTVNFAPSSDRDEPGGMHFAPSAENGAVLSASAVLGGAEHKSTSTNFEAADLTALMGGLNVDFRGAVMAADSALIEVSAVLGGIDIIVPPDWSVESHITPFLGGFENKTHPPLPPAKRVVIRGSVVLGGVSVKN
jgi:predicted membrane protein